jgi:GTPase SAR1 family protein
VVERLIAACAERRDEAERAGAGVGGVRFLEGHGVSVWGCAWSPDGTRLLSASYDSTLGVWDAHTGQRLLTLEGHTNSVRGCAWSPDGTRLLSASFDNTLGVWDAHTGQRLLTLEGHTGLALGCAWSPDGARLLSASDDKTLGVWDASTGQRLLTLEGHTKSVFGCAWSPDGTRALSASADGRLGIWTLSAGVDDADDDDGAASDARYKNAKVVLIGDTGVGKSGLCQRLEADTWDPHGAWEDTAGSTHGVHIAQIELPQPSAAGEPAGDGAGAPREDREVWLWDFAGQPDYQIVNQLHLHDASLALLVFNPQQADPFEHLRRWDERLMQAVGERAETLRKLLVAARTDRGGAIASDDDLARFCEQAAYARLHSTSAKSGEGMDELRQSMSDHIPWQRIPGTLSTALFRALKRAVVAVADHGERWEHHAVVMPEAAIASALAYQIPERSFSPDELRTAIDLLARLGLTARLGFGGLVALDPARLNQYASAIVRQARKAPNGLGFVREADVLAGHLDLEGVDRLDEHQEQLMLKGVSTLFIERGLCLADRDDDRNVLIFPQLFRRPRPQAPTLPATVVAYTFEGAEDHVYATLVVRLANTTLFQQHDFYQDAARFRIAECWAYITLTTDGSGRHRIEIAFEDRTHDQTKAILLRFVHDHILARAMKPERIRLYRCPKCGMDVDESRIEARRAKGRDTVICDGCDTVIRLDDLVERETFSEQVGQSSRRETEAAERRIDAAAKGRQLHYHAGLIVEEAGQIYRDRSQADYGIDAEIEFTDDARRPTGRRVYLQLKSGDSHLRRRMRDEAHVFDIKKPRWAEYWANHESPVMLVIKTDDGSIRWMDVREPIRAIRASTGEWPRQVTFDGEPFTAVTVKRLRERTLDGPASA